MDVYVEERPWGKFEKYIENQKCTVKILYLQPNAQTSVQYHSLRDEWWKVIKGSVLIMVDNQEYKLKENDSFSIKKGLVHQIINLEHVSWILEISTGEFKEQDIVRVKDIYNRTN
ncbi:MAG: phosphomannose isomerase type II C-terminal cupin domain [Thermoproteota archaeon]|nr:phosphomannose isomerase type II C-terminal cupin domain [Thermoproteota archaeon]